MSAGRFLLLFAVACNASADDRVDSIRAAAAEIRGIDVPEAQAAVLSCYRKQRPYRTCVTQDFIVSNVAARSADDPQGVIEEMAVRVTGTMLQNNVPLDEAREFIILVKQHGFAQ